MFDLLIDNTLWHELLQALKIHRVELFHSGKSLPLLVPWI